MTKPKRCGNCGSSKLVQSTKLDTLNMPWKDYPSVLLESPFNHWSCGDCDEVLLNASQTKELDQAISRSIQMQVQYFISNITKRENCDQKELAKHLGVTPESLSRIRKRIMMK